MNCVKTTKFVWKKKKKHLDQTVVSVVIQVFPCALFPVLIRHHARSPRDSTLRAAPFGREDPGLQVLL